MDSSPVALAAFYLVLARELVQRYRIPPTLVLTRRGRVTALLERYFP